MRSRNVKKCRFQVEPLEGRVSLSATGAAHHALAAEVAPKTVPYKEFATLVSTIPTGVNTSATELTGTATYFGSVTILINSTVDPSTGVVHQTFARVGANGATMFGTAVATPTGNTTGVVDTLAITVTGGTGRFKGVTGSQTGVIYVDPTTHVQTSDVEGTLTFPGSSA